MSLAFPYQDFLSSAFALRQSQTSFVSPIDLSCKFPSAAQGTSICLPKELCRDHNYFGHPSSHAQALVHELSALLHPPCEQLIRRKWLHLHLSREFGAAPREY